MADDVVSNEQLTEPGNEEAMNTERPTTEADTARLMITKIVNENFKSYAGIQELGPFHKVNNVVKSCLLSFIIASTFCCC